MSSFISTHIGFRSVELIRRWHLASNAIEALMRT
jgi:hypothetical protein